MQYVFKFPLYNSTLDLNKRISSINRFLANHVSKECNHRHFGIELFKPNFSLNSCKRKCVRKFALMPEHEGHYLLGFFFFNSSKDNVGNLSLIVDLGKEITEDTKRDIAIFSSFASFSLDSVIFGSTDHILTITFESDSLGQILSDCFSHVLKTDNTDSSTEESDN